jgi:hypothetical protein
MGSYIEETKREPLKEVISVQFHRTYLRERTDEMKTEYDGRIEKGEEEKTRG